jgi:hypothetical protein
MGGAARAAAEREGVKTRREFLMNGCRALVAVLLLLAGFASMGFPRADPDDEKAKALARLAKQKLEAARKTYEVLWSDYREGFRISDDTLYRWSLRLLEAEMEVGKQPADQTAAIKAHRDRMVELERLIQRVRQVRQATINEVSATEYYRTEADAWVLQGKVDKKSP